MTEIIVCNNCNTKLSINKLKYTCIYEEKEIQRQFNSKIVLKLKKKLEYLEVQKEINISLTKIRTTFLLIIAGCLIYLLFSRILIFI